MNATRIATLALAAFATACAAPADPAASDPEAPPAAVDSTPAADGVALRLEHAQRNLDVGRDVAGARTALDEVVRDPSATGDQRDEARLALSRALEVTGDREGAIAAVEGLLADHPDGDRWPLGEATEARLRKLLTGSDAAPPRPQGDESQAPPPFAQTLAHYFPVPADEKQPLELNVVTFGGVNASDRLGTFDVARAIREERRRACSLCEDHLRINTNKSGYGSWTRIPAAKNRLPGALTVYYFDLADPIPARYDAELPLPSAEIAARLERGDGLVAARERPGAPPAIVIAAPRAAQLADVEEALAQMKTLPTEPAAVALKSSLRAAEIQAVVRRSFGAFRSCYETFLTRDPSAAGKVNVRFAIQGDGLVTGVSAETVEGALHDPAFESCMVSATSALVFPATKQAGSTTVTYPILFSP
jgi:hypothetical protein